MAKEETNRVELRQPPCSSPKNLPQNCWLNKLPDQKLNISNFNVGDQCAVTYEKNVYAGEISNIFGTELEVNVLIPSGSYWKWTKKI